MTFDPLLNGALVSILFLARCGQGGSYPPNWGYEEIAEGAAALLRLNLKTDDPLVHNFGGPRESIPPIPRGGRDQSGAERMQW